MSEYLRIKKQIDELHAALEKARVNELEHECTEIRKRIEQFSIPVEMLYPHAAQQPRKRSDRSTRPAMYEWGGNKWHGGKGPKPEWFVNAQKAGITLDQMRIKPNGAPAAGP